MSLQDPIADMLTRIRNACMARHETVSIPATGLKEEMLKIFIDEGYVGSYQRKKIDKFDQLVVVLNYTEDGEPVIKGIKRVSRPGLRRYAKSDSIPKVLSGIGHAIVSTSDGVMTGQKAKKLRIGGEVLCSIW